MTDEPPLASCVGQWTLFDSTERDAHARAREICMGCPVRSWCDENTAQIKRRTPAGMVLQGTWAGRLQGVSKASDQERMKREDAAFGIEEAASAHAAYRRGDRGAWVETGYHVHERRRARAARERRSA